MVGSIGIFDANSLGIVVIFLLWCYIQVTYIETIIYLW